MKTYEIKFKDGEREPVRIEADVVEDRGGWLTLKARDHETGELATLAVFGPHVWEYCVPVADG